ncbi:hypothetical protein CLAFUW4_09309 [Fulvia fulva]|uniref:Uncharacterized protein n=1 Tax=Passalora fulva TaxID=5499 RepID=A0A9Q8PGC2_PASFU|nr:uncharacterized protein CLAFUR5_09410 [Fulvia fulva]KAK4613289.1 hypothetical protein CLAFUR4_09315 [Fulvia fulva]KAK4614276.1 hypothetical protein CLAFUR0_09307 [Fulvia fulva]UJO21916.1 hypothetical protein CLAFUR5_09410 [Fulvia fulva]WPV19857.1 hypothetical protein CLAFUW4_09309 [Fulvia fulva]WPV35206.1 hypothetical protein CLAFUW7_09310 [Fulvia fulva]
MSTGWLQLTPMDVPSFICSMYIIWGVHRLDLGSKLFTDLTNGPIREWDQLEAKQITLSRLPCVVANAMWLAHFKGSTLAWIIFMIAALMAWDAEMKAIMRHFKVRMDEV